MISLCSCRLQRLGFGLGAYLVSLVFGGSAMAQSAAAPPPALVVVAPVVVSQLPTGRTFVGSSEGVRVSVVGSAVDGRVIAVHYREGDEVIHEGERPPALVQLKTETIAKSRASAFGVNIFMLKLRKIYNTYLKHFKNGKIFYLLFGMS